MSETPEQFDDGPVVEEAVLDGDIELRRGTAQAALRHRNFRIVWLGTLASNVGTWMQNVALGVLAYHLTHSAQYVALIGFMQLGPILALGLVGGALADMFDRRRLLVLTNLEQLAFSLVLAVVASAASPSRTLLVLVVLAIGIGNALSAPPLSALLPSLVPRADLSGAVSLQSVQLNLSRVIGPAIGGALYPVIAARGVFVVNAGTYLFAVATLLAVPSPHISGRDSAERRGWRRITGGLVVARHDAYVRRILLTIASFSLLCLPFVGLLPVVAERNLRLDTQGAAYGLLYAAFALGAALGAISVGTVLVRTERARVVRVGLASFAVSLTVFALLRDVVAAYVAVFVLGATYFATVTGLSTSLQEHLADAVRGRVMALYTMGFGGTVPVGLLLFGAVAERWSVTLVMLMGAGVALVMAVVDDLRDVAPQRAG